MKPSSRRLVLFVLLVSFCVHTKAQEWPRFRGPNGTGRGLATHLPTQCSREKSLWTTRLPGVGHSSPVLWGDRLFVTSAERAADNFVVVCLDGKTGALEWRKDYPGPHYRLHANNNFASATAAADEQHVYVLRVEGNDLFLTALQHHGASAWEYKVGPFKTEHGLGHSPVVQGNRVIFSDDQDLVGRIVALDSTTGRMVWEAPRNPGRADYSTPCLLEVEGSRPCLVFNSQEDGICAVDAQNGRLVWKAESALDKRSVSSPIVAAGLVFGSCGSGGGGNYVVALRPPEGAGRAPVTAYEIRRSAPYVPTPVAVGEWVFLWSDGGIVTCVHATTGRELWQQRVGGNFFSSPVYADGKLFGTSIAGEVIVLAAGSEFKELGRGALGEPSHATPAIANGRIYFRTLNNVLAFGP